MNRQDICLPDQTRVEPAPWPRQPVPPVEQPDALGNEFRSPGRRAYPQKQRDREILRFGVGPDDLRAGNAAPITPSMDKIEAEQYPQAQAHEPLERPLVLVFGIFDDAAVFLGPKIAVRQMVVDADDLAPVPFRLPLACAEAVSQVNKYPDRSIAEGNGHDYHSSESHRDQPGTGASCRAAGAGWAERAGAGPAQASPAKM